MKYIVCETPGHFDLDDKPSPSPKADEALLKILRVGICGTDIHAFAGNQAFFQYPRILGHELAAEIVEIGPNEKNLKPGDLVSIMPYLSCGKCIACRNSKPNCCTNIQVLGVHTDGGMQEFISLPIDILLPASGLSADEIALIEPLAIGAHAIRRAQLQAGETIAVMGCGPIGMGILKMAQIEGANVIAMDVNQQRLDYAAQAFGIEHLVNVLEEPVRKMEEITDGDLATAVFDATGNAKALMSGPDYMSHGGRFVLVGLSKGELCYSHPAIHAKESSILCSRYATIEDFEYVIDMLKGGKFPTDSYITHRVRYEEMIDRFPSFSDPKEQVMKAIIDWE
ncbi:MAG: zinc-binding alcohol dehydrogenase family protein [Bacteroidota bacterium]